MMAILVIIIIIMIIVLLEIATDIMLVDTNVFSTAMLTVFAVAEAAVANSYTT